MVRSKTLIKIAAALGVLAGLGFLFVRSARDSRSKPYTIDGERLRNWALVLDPGSRQSGASSTPGASAASSPPGPMLALRPPPELAMGLFKQVFARAMESLNAPAVSAIPLLLQGEFDRAFAGRATPDALLGVARNAGLESAAFEPRCLAYRRVSAPGITRQLYFVLFDAPAFGRFREQIGALLNGGAGPRADFDPAALSPVLFIAASDPMFDRWLPLRANPGTDCVAPIAR
jgi:hypothetical protein